MCEIITDCKYSNPTWIIVYEKTSALIVLQVRASKWSTVKIIFLLWFGETLYRFYLLWSVLYMLIIKWASLRCKCLYLCVTMIVFLSLPSPIWRTPNMFSSAVYLFHGRNWLYPCGLAVRWVYWVWRSQWWAQLSCVLRVPVPVCQWAVYWRCPEMQWRCQLPG